MEPAAAGCRLHGPKTLTQKRRNDPRQYIAASANSHAGISGQVAVAYSAVGDQRSPTLAHQNTSKRPGKVYRRFGTV